MLQINCKIGVKRSMSGDETILCSCITQKKCSYCVSFDNVMAICVDVYSGLKSPKELSPVMRITDNGK